MYRSVPKEAWEKLAAAMESEFWKGMIIHEGEIIGVVVENEFIVFANGRIFKYMHSFQNFKEVADRMTSAGYYQVRIHGKDVSKHRLIARCFCRREPGKNEVNHIDGNKLNNRADNLEWVNRSENMLHAYRLGLHPRCGRRPAYEM